MLGWLALVVVLIAIVWFGWHRLFTPKPIARATPPIPVSTTRVAQQTVPITRTGIGNVLPVMSVTVHTRVDGQLDSVAFKEGQDVKTGQLLARIDPRTYQAQLDQSVAQKAKDAASLADARIDLARYQQLIKEDATTQQTLDTQRSTVAQLEASVKNDAAQIEYARVNLSYTTISAPITGRIGARLVDPGNIVHAADTTGLLVINQIDPIDVQFTLPEADFQAVNAALHRQSGGKAGALTVQALDRNTHEVLATGHLVLLNNQIDTTTGTIALKAQFPNPQHKLWPGQSVDGRLVLGERQQALTVPSAVVQRGQDGLFAYVVGADDKVRAQPITVADALGNTTVVTQGLAAGDRVVVDGQYRLTDGARVSEFHATNGKGGSAGPGAGGAKSPSSSAPASAQEQAP
jgi:multidrug efflux system membrane fusion protein